MRLVSMAMIAGVSQKEAWLMNPGVITDLFFMRRKYDAQMHGRVIGNVDEDGDWE